MTTDSQRRAAGRVAKDLAQRAKEATHKNAVELVAGPAHLKNIDRWIKQQNDPSIDRIEAIRRLIEIALSRNTEKAA
jgi:hypothetical protein